MKKFLLVILSVIFLGIGLLFGARLFLGWNDGMRHPRSEIHTASLDQKLYIAGGIGLFKVLDSCETFDLSTQNWSDCGILPRALHHVAMAADGQHVYASGGYVSLPFQADLKAGLFRYDLPSKSWSEISKLPHPIGQHAMVHFDGDLYLIGGQNNGADLDSLWHYDIAKDHWSALPPMPVARHSHAIARDGPYLYVTGGRNAQDGTEMQRIDSYHLIDNQWSRLPDMPVGRAGHGAFTSNGKLHIFGGEALSENKVLDDHMILDLQSGEWTSAPRLLQPRHGFAVSDVKIGNEIVIVGGGARAGLETIFSVTGTVQMLNLQRKIKGLEKSPEK
ncbi:MAG: kelch repeat-containing protein [Parasphingorhabdus sp.]|uniref:Kelch repeat-containing protein n=1 Tax=Parasphingorhabdus sp. TaxID=2709688 RepID=UPI0032971209